MCGRISLYSEPDRIARIMQAELSLDPKGWQQKWNTGPTDPIWGVSEDGEGIRTLSAYRWGFLPSWAKDPKQLGRSFNARAETVASKSTFRAAFQKHRILIPVDGFYEWGKSDKLKVPNFFTRRDGEPIVFAGLKSWWRSPQGEEIRSATIITTDAGPDMDEIHDRMPVVLDRDAWEHWLDRSVEDRDELESLLVPVKGGTLVHHEVDRAVGNVRNDGPELVAAVNSL
jgi:putative SOS response-associated peptidase YedK